MIYRRLLLVLTLCIACKPAPKQTATPAAVPRQNATVVTIRTTAGKQVTNHEIVIANGRARNTGEHEVWRLYDTKADTVTFVDDVDKTYRIEPLASIVKKRHTTMAAAIPAHFPHAKLTRGGSKTILGVNAQQQTIEAGAYRRELWIGEHPAIPDDLFAMMVASDAPSSPLAPMMRVVDEELLRAKGFPLVDRSELPLGNAAHVVERTVLSVVSRPVPQSLFAIPKDYKDVTPKPARKVSS